MAGLRASEIPTRRPSRRSRYGCRNCKLRKLKCDENKPHCNKCGSFGVFCNYFSDIPDLQPLAADRGGDSLLKGPSQNPPVSSAVWSCDRSTSFRLNARHQEFISRYLGRSLISPDEPNVKYVNRCLLSLAFEHPFLMHASLGVAFAYDRHLNAPSRARRSLEECFHLAQATTLLKQRLKEPIAEKDKDPIWGTAAALVTLTFSSPDARTPEESWPLNSSGSSGLDWLPMNKSKMAMWHVMNPLRSNSLFRVMAVTFSQMEVPLPVQGRDGISPNLASLCRLTDFSTAEDNSYFDSAHGLSYVLGIPDSEITIGHASPFMRSVDGPFEDLLRRRDPVALLLLYLWYRKSGRAIWWIGLRARVECPSIRSYLQICRHANIDVQAFLHEYAISD
ncbi:hypothetical protein N7470_007720 [Penicillium chermesinum]|nr:hypothetical protein N7470_007720 [Penicillium chermesinum]